MKVRTADALFDLVAEDLAWRKKELAVFRATVERVDFAARPALLRASVALLYAHWEGSVKNYAHWYLCFLAGKRMRIEELPTGVTALAVKSHMRLAWDSSRPRDHIELVSMIRQDGVRLKIPTDRDAVRTMSNLSSKVLEDVLTSIGCDFARFNKYSDLIDEQLVAQRNRIVHGEYDNIAVENWDELRSVVVEIMDDIATEIVNNAATA